MPIAPEPAHGAARKQAENMLKHAETGLAGNRPEQTRAGRPVSLHTGRPALSSKAARGELPQNVNCQLLSLPVSCAAVSWTRSFQVPLAVSPEAFTE